MKTRQLLIAIFIIMILGFFNVAVSTNTNTPSSTVPVYEEELYVEDWMTHPFVDSFEEPLEVEDWMIEPFKIN
jgi:hypothetical protein